MNDRGMILSRMKLHLFMTHCCVDGLRAQPMEIDGVIELHSKVNRTERIVAVYSKYTIQIEKKNSEWEMCLAGYFGLQTWLFRVTLGTLGCVNI